MTDDVHPLGEHAHKYNLEPQKEEKKVVNALEQDVRPQHHADTDFERSIHEKASQVQEELLRGFHAIAEYPKSVTFFGSARIDADHPYYQKAERLASRICTLGYTVITGGGPGIMEAGNRGSKNTCHVGVGFNIELPSVQIMNPYITHGVNFSSFPARKISLFFSAEAYLYFPGGYGTLDEFFQLITNIQTGKAPKTPVILVGSEFWNDIDALIRTKLLDKWKTISPGDVNLYKILDDEDAIIEIIKTAPLRQDYN